MRSAGPRGRGRHPADREAPRKRRVPPRTEETHGRTTPPPRPRPPPARGPLVRVYVFSLVANIPREEGISAALHAAEAAAAVPASGSASTSPADFTWVIHFHYPEDQAERLALRVRRNQNRQLSRVSGGRAETETGIDPASWNWQYTFAGASTQAPVNVFDDGRHTYFQFDPQTRVPAIFMVHEDETESLVNAVRRGRFLVVHDTGRQFTLRNGPVETCVFNEAFNPAPSRTLNSPREDPAYMERSGAGYSQRDGRNIASGTGGLDQPRRLFRLAVGASSPTRNITGRQGRRMASGGSRRPVGSQGQHITPALGRDIASDRGRKPAPNHGGDTTSDRGQSPAPNHGGDITSGRAGSMPSRDGGDTTSGRRWNISTAGGGIRLWPTHKARRPRFPLATKAATMRPPAG